MTPVTPAGGPASCRAELGSATMAHITKGASRFHIQRARAFSRAGDLMRFAPPHPSVRSTKKAPQFRLQWMIHFSTRRSSRNLGDD